MMRRFFATFVACALFATAGCSKEKSETKESAASAPEAAHAAASAKPGSYEDWCDEHKVPESQCTLCHPDLIAAFKATGDWCAEHSMPESQCRKCNPDLKIARGPKTN